MPITTHPSDFSLEVAGRHIDAFIKNHTKEIKIGAIVLAAFGSGLWLANRGSTGTGVDKDHKATVYEITHPGQKYTAEMAKADKARAASNAAVAEAKAKEEADMIPAEAESFVAEYGKRYDDTATAVSVFYAEKDYEQANGGKSLMIPDSYVKNFEPRDITGETIPQVSDHGFESYSLPLDVDINDPEISKKIFNDYVAKSLSLYMNLVARNTSKEARAIIDDEFTNYCSESTGEFYDGTYRNGAFTLDNEAIGKLMSFAKSIVDKHGSAINYSVEPVTTDTNKMHDPGTSFMFDTLPSKAIKLEFNGQGIDYWVPSIQKLAIKIDEYSKDLVSTSEDRSYSFPMTMMRQPITFSGSSSTKISIGKF